MRERRGVWRRLGWVALACVGAAWCGEAAACEPPFNAWFVQDTFPAADGEEAPINGVIAVYLDYVEAAASVGFPDAATWARTVRPEVLRGGEEEVPGEWLFEPELKRMRFIAARDFAEGVSYTVRIGLLNSLLPAPTLEDGTFTFTFTTGSGRDEAAPAFSGLQEVGLTEVARPEQACCASVEEACVCGSCTWCWTVGWSYPRVVDLRFAAASDEFGVGAVDYRIYRVEGAEATPIGVVRSPNAEVRLRLPLEDPEESGPYCFEVRAVDVFGRESGVGVTRCVEDAALVPIERQEVPEPDRSFCAPEDGEEVGVEEDAGEVEEDTGSSGGEEVGMGGEDAGVEDAEAPNVVTGTGGSDDGCGCDAPGRRPGAPWGLVGLLLLLGVPAVWRRR